MNHRIPGKRPAVLFGGLLMGFVSSPTFAQALSESETATTTKSEMSKQDLRRETGTALPSVAPESVPREAPESTPSAEPEKKAGPEQIVIVGSRRQTDSAIRSPTPVDIIDVGKFRNQGNTDMDNMLRSLVPSYNVNPQPISDAATLIRPANLRGLPPDNTVVLVNGKRRHRGSVIAFQGGGVSDGAQGVDLAVIPSLALKRVEVLRDGAAAQYGADAIAGVMNFVLNDAPQGVTIDARYGSTYEGDGDAWIIAGNVGLPLTDDGYANFTFEYGNSDPTSRSVQREDAAGLIAGGNTNVANPAQIWGSPEVDDNLKLFANLGLNLDHGVKTYLFGNFAQRTVTGGFFFRNPNTRSGVFSNDGGMTRLVGDLNPDNNTACPSINIADDNLDQILSDPLFSGDDPECFVFNQRFPGGFTPQFGGNLEDWSLVGGLQGVSDSGLIWDLSASLGQNQVQFFIQNTINASLGPDTPTEFTPGAYSQFDQTYNFDVVYPLEVSFLASPLNIAAGVEYRREAFNVTAGDPESFEIGPLFQQGFSIGSNGFPGFGNNQAGTFDRQNGAGYLDFESDVTSWWLLGLAGRIEHFDTFGTTINGKASTRFTLSRFLSLRGTAGTGFRAPTPGQANITNVSTVAAADGTLENRGTIPPTNPLAVEFGGRELDPERSVNFGGGLVLNGSEFLDVDDVTLTADYYNIRVTDRITQSATIELTPEEAQRLEDSGIRGASDLSQFRFYTNAFDTRTQGLDVVLNYLARWERLGIGNTQLILSYSWNQTDLETSVEDSDVIDAQRKQELEESLPRHRLIMTANHMYGPFRVLARMSYYGNHKFPQNTDDFVYGAKTLFDLEAAYTLFDRITLVAGVQNIFDTVPDESPNQLADGALYPENAAMGYNGGFWYFRLQGQL